ncbi:hypothetical protein B0H14DRAFT_384740 [Mycena olivaceomarginata]|nr:hypothetical protein B0H14DRAFT_384740 [Mycena olivaceomarginata]
MLILLILWAPLRGPWQTCPSRLSRSLQFRRLCTFSLTATSVRVWPAFLRRFERTKKKVVYCSGYTISGRACRLRQGTASGKSEKWFCHHHINSVHAFRAFSSRNRKRSNSLACIPRFELDRISPMRLPEFIPAYLELTSQAALKVQMMQPISLDAPVGRTSFPVKTLEKMVAKPPTKTRSITSC